MTHSRLKFWIFPICPKGIVATGPRGCRRETDRNENSLDGALGSRGLDVFAVTEGIIDEEEQAGHHILDQCLGAEADRQAEDREAGDQRPDIDAQHDQDGQSAQRQKRGLGETHEQWADGGQPRTDHSGGDLRIARGTRSDARGHDGHPVPAEGNDQHEHQNLGGFQQDSAPRNADDIQNWQEPEDRQYRENR